MAKTLPALVVALVAALLAVPATYAILRAVDACTTSGGPPMAGALSVHVPMFWRLWVGTYVGGIVGAVAFLVARAHLHRTVRVLQVLVVVVAALVGVQGLFLP